MASVGVLDIEWPQGDTFDKLVIWKDENRDPVPLDGYEARMQLRTSVDSDTVVLELSTTNGRISLGSLAEDTEGHIQFAVTAEDMAAVEAATYRYDLEMVSGDHVRKLLKGKFKVVAEVTREDA